LFRGFYSRPLRDALALLEAGATFYRPPRRQQSVDEIVIELTATFHVPLQERAAEPQPAERAVRMALEVSATRVAVPIKERRSVSDRRSGADRRRVRMAPPGGIERRNGERRMGLERRHR